MFLQLCITIKQVSVTDISRMVFLSSFLALSSPLANPIIYFVMWKRYRQAFLQMLWSITCRLQPHKLRQKANCVEGKGYKVQFHFFLSDKCSFFFTGN